MREGPNPREKKEAAIGDFTLDARAMELHAKWRSEQMSFSGPGRIWQSTNGQIRFRFFDTDATKSGVEAALSRLSTPSSFDLGEGGLSCEDFGGRKWRGRDLRDLSFNHSRGAVCEGRIRELTLEFDQKVEQDSLVLHFPNEVDYPANARTDTEVRRHEPDTGESRTVAGRAVWDVWKLQSETWSARLKPDDGGGMRISLGTEDGTQLPSGIERRVKETLWFVLAEPVEWSIALVRSEDGSRFILRDTTAGGALSIVPQPYAHLGRGSSGAIPATKLFAAYLSYISRYSKARYHPMSVLLRRILRAGASTLDDLEQAVCLALEGIVQRGFPADVREPTEHESLAASVALDLLSGDDWLAVIQDEDTRTALADRIRGLIGIMKRDSARGAILDRLPRGGVITEVQAKMWDDLRHPIAHGAEVSGAVEDRASGVRMLISAFYQLVFCLIGYQGEYTHWTGNGPERREFSPGLECGYCWEDGLLDA